MSGEAVAIIIGAVFSGVVALLSAKPIRAGAMRWFEARKESADSRQAAANDAFGYTRSQQEREIAKLEREIEVHREALAVLKSELEAKIARLEKHISDLQADLSQSHIYNAQLMADLDQSKAELKRALEAYDALIRSIPTILARRMGEEEGK